MLVIVYPSLQVWFKNRRAKFRKKQRALKIKEVDKDKHKETTEGTASTSTEGGTTETHIDTAGRYTFKMLCMHNQEKAALKII